MNDISSVFADNLKCLRLAKGYTQEQTADLLGVSPQAVSRWERSATYPDILLLPAIAELFCVTVDDLFHPRAEAYPNYAHRLLAVYESSRDREDFLRADNEFRRLLAGESVWANDLRAYGILHEIAMQDCFNRAQSMYDEAITRSEAENDSDTFRRTCLQKIHLLSNNGLDDKNLDEWGSYLAGHDDDPWAHILYLASLYYGGQYDKAHQHFRAVAERFPQTAELFVFGGNICSMIKRYDEAFLFWDKALSLDSQCRDAAYAKAHCRESLGEYAQAGELWERLADELEASGFESESRYPRAMAERCREKSGHK